MAGAAPPSPSASASSSDVEPAALNLADDNDGWEDVQPEEQERVPVRCLFSDHVFDSAEEMLADCKRTHSFDVLGVVRDLELDFEGCIRLVNYLRTEVAGGDHAPKVNSTEVFQDDRYLVPALPDDALLFCLGDILDLASALQPGNEPLKELTGESAKQTPASTVAELEERLRQLQSQFDEYRRVVAETLDKRWAEREPTSATPATAKDRAAEIDTQYFDSYSYTDIHETMLRDTARTSSYRDFMYENKHLFAGKTVLDIGCGTGILSMFAAKAGAAHVVAVDNSAIIDKAREIVATNGLLDRVSCVKGRVEDIELPPPAAAAGIDIIVSEWMGYALLYEAMLPSLLAARDRFAAAAKRPALIVPSHCTLHIAPLADPAYRADVLEGFWSDVYGFDMSSVLSSAAGSAKPAPPASVYDDVHVRTVPAAAVPAPSHRFRTLALATVAPADLRFAAPFSCTLAAAAPDGLDGFAIWFDTFFLPAPGDALPDDALPAAWPAAASSTSAGVRHRSWPPGASAADAPATAIAFSTGPDAVPTHWKQATLMIHPAHGHHRQSRGARPAPLPVGAVVAGSVAYRSREGDERALDIEVTWEVRTPGADGAPEGEVVDHGSGVWSLR